MKKLWITIGVVLLVGLVAALVYLNLTSDKTGPEIVFETTDYEYHEGDPYDDLLSGVSAVDDVDGDVTDSLMIVSVLPLTDNTRAKVQYVAKDKANNLSITDIMVKYIPSPGGSDDTSEESTDSVETGDSLDSLESIDSTDTTEDGNSMESLEDAASMGIIRYPYIKLSSNEITINKGAYFDVLSVIEELVDDKDNLWRRIQVYGTYDTDVAGTYQLTYYATDTESNQTNVEYLTLHVIE